MKNASPSSTIFLLSISHSTLNVKYSHLIRKLLLPTWETYMAGDVKCMKLLHWMFSFLFLYLTLVCWISSSIGCCFLIKILSFIVDNIEHCGFCRRWWWLKITLSPPPREKIPLKQILTRGSWILEILKTRIFSTSQ